VWTLDHRLTPAVLTVRPGSGFGRTHALKNFAPVGISGV